MTFRDDDATKAMLAQIVPIPPGVSLDVLLAYNPAFLELPRLLEPQERVAAYCISKIEQKGTVRSKGNWLVTCTDRRLLFVSRSMMRSAEHFAIGRHEIVALEESKGWFFNDVKVVTPAFLVKLFQYGRPDMERVLAALRAR